MGGEERDEEHEMSKKTAVVVATDGTEEIELVAAVDVLRRGGVEVSVMALEGDGRGWIEGSHGIRIGVDGEWDEEKAKGADLFMVPGGMRGVERMKEDERVLRVVRERRAAGKWVAAICAGPMVLKAAGALEGGVGFTCHPSVAGRLEGASTDGANCVVDLDAKVATSRGAGTAVDFGTELLGILVGADKAWEVAGAMVHRP
jgi:4-methyl-5(b-hydroxyethyl)-thiazole monophosphate biosynthesis